MKTIYAEAQPGKVVLKEKEIPAPGKGEVLLKAKYSAMSPGTENGLLGEHIVPFPTSIGYAMAAEVIEVGEAVEDLKVGDHVVATVEHAQYVVTSELNCTLCPEGVDLNQAAFWNLGHTGMYALRRSNLQMGEPYLTSIRMEEAIKLLIQTDAKTYEIGEKVGYNNVRRFVDAFKQIYSMSPMEYRKTFRED